ncbi:MAG: exodeoxyribonuclease VII large subunit [Rikenellaceae bacterium]|nr:exodeoxyribonuclease VII large subunit [Rikenellaceae bacterium]
MADLPKHITLFQLQSQIREKMGHAFPLPYWVVAEINEFKVNYSGHCYIELVEKGGDNQIPKAKVNAVIWRSHHSMISSYFRSATGRELCAGIKVLLKVVINYHELYGLSFQITDIEPSYTIGDLEAQKKVTIESLKADGVFEMNKELDLPEVLQRIAVVSSRNAAGFQDFINEINNNQRGYSYHIELFDAFVQGNEAEESIISALDAVADRSEDFDCVLIIRGGGSQSDLGAFDSYRLCCHITQFPLPIITGIGHDKDQSVADMVAKISLKTPTATAVFLTEHNALFEGRLDSYRGYLSGIASDSLHTERQRIKEFGYILCGSTERVISKNKSGIAVKQSALYSLTAENIRRNKDRIKLHSSAITGTATGKLKLLGQRLYVAEQEINRALKSFIFSRKEKINFLERLKSSADPANILKKGFALIKINGAVLKSVNDADTGERIEVILRDGTFTTEVKEKTKYHGS